MDKTPVSSVRRWRTVLAVLAGCLVLTACEAPLPDVTFYGNGSAVHTGPTTICAVDRVQAVIECPDTATGSLPRLTLRPGDRVQINVPTEIAKSVWGVEYTYQTEDGAVVRGRPLTFVDGRLAASVTPPTSQDQLLTVAVRDGFLPVVGDDGNEAIQPTRAWQLLVDPVPASAATSAE